MQVHHKVLIATSGITRPLTLKEDHVIEPVKEE